jgi:ABC-type transport system substrate-binding protein
MKKGIYLLVVILLTVGFMLAACSNPTTSTTTSPPPTGPAATSPTVTTPASTTPVTSAPPSSSTSPSSSQPQYGGTLRIISSAGDPLDLGDPSTMSDLASIGGVIPCLQSLVFADNSGQMHGVLAESWQLAPDLKSITFNLRKGVKFQDGTDFNAQAAKWNLDRDIAAKKTPLWSSVDVIDDYTIRINLKSYQNTILNDLEGTAGMMVSPTAAQTNGTDWLLTHPVGTGPYQFKSFSKDVSLEYTRFNDYWGGKPYLDGIKFIFVADPTTGELAFESGIADVINTGTDQITHELVQKGYKLEKRPGAMAALIPDSNHPSSPFSNIKVRQAVEYAIDRQALVNTFGYGLWEVVNQPASAAQFGHIDDSPYKYDLAKAKQLMQEAGYPNGFKTTIITASIFDQNPLLAIQSQLSAIGINASLNVQDYAAWSNTRRTGWDNGLLRTVQGATDVNYVSFLNRYFINPVYTPPVMAEPAGLTDLINKALVTSDLATETSLCQQAVELLVQDATEIPLYIPPSSYILTDKVHDTNFSNIGGSGFRWSAEKAWLSK